MTEGPAPLHPKRTLHDPRGRTPPTHAAEARIGRRTDHTGTRPPATGDHTGDGGSPTRGERATPTEDAALNTAVQPTTTPSPPGDDPSHHKGHLTSTGRGQRHGHSTQSKGLGPPEHTGQRHRAPGRATPRTPTRPTSPSDTPRPPQHRRSEPPGPNRTPKPPASHTPTRTPHQDAGQTDLHRPTTAQHEAARHTAPQRPTVQRTTTRHPKAQHATARRDATRHRAACRGTSQRNTAHHSTPQHQSKGR